MNSKQRDTAIGLLDDYLTYLALASGPVSQFDKSLLLTTAFVDTGVQPDDPVCYSEATAADLEYAWTVKVLGEAWPDNPKVAGSLFVLYRDETVDRGRVERFRGQMPGGRLSFYECFSRRFYCAVRPDGTTWQDEYFAGYRGRKITFFDPRESAGVAGLRTKKHDPDALVQQRLTLGAAFMLPSFWQAHVAIQEGSPRVSMLTDPTGVKELWKFRDLPDGARRRDALLHWVSEHWRRTRNDPEVEGYVRACLRGSREVRCTGLRVTVEESREDREKILKMIQDRKLMRETRVDRRLRRRNSGV